MAAQIRSETVCGDAMGPDDAIQENTVETSFTGADGVRGRLLLKSGRGQSGQHEHCGPRRSRSLVPPKIQRMIGVIASAASASGEGDTSGLFLQYQMFRQHNLNLDALRTLQQMLAAEPLDPTLLQWRKDLCQQMQLNEEYVPLIAAP